MEVFRTEDDVTVVVVETGPEFVRLKLTESAPSAAVTV